MKKIDAQITPGIDKRYSQICKAFFDGDVYVFAEQCGLSVAVVEMLIDPRESISDHPTINRILLKVIPNLSMRWLWYGEGKMLIQSE